MYFKLEPQQIKSDNALEDALWLRDNNDHLISFREKEAADHYTEMVKESEAFLQAVTLVQPAALHPHLCEFDNNGYIIQLKLPRTLTPDSGIIVLSAGRPQAD